MDIFYTVGFFGRFPDSKPKCYAFAPGDPVIWTRGERGVWTGGSPVPRDCYQICMIWRSVL